MKYLGPNGLQHFYDKYIRPLKDAAYKSVANNLTTEEEGSVLDARQGKELDEKKIDKDNIVNDLTTEEEGSVLDARQGKALDDKINKINEYLSNQTITSDMFAFQSFYDIMFFTGRKSGNTLYFSTELFYKGQETTMQPNQFYKLNNVDDVDPAIIPKGFNVLQITATNGAYTNAVAGFALMNAEGQIEFSFPSDPVEPTYIFICGIYETAN